MTDSFDRIVVDTKCKFVDLQSSTKHCMAKLPMNMPSAGIYLFSENGCPLYVGRTNSLRKRLQNHIRNNHHQATFAFLLARHQTGETKASYKPNGSRQDLLSIPEFRIAFDNARQRIKNMDIQFVEEKDPIKQAILEIYTAVQTQAKYNNFENH
jgi:hypothetical protein